MPKSNNNNNNNKGLTVKMEDSETESGEFMEDKQSIEDDIA